MECLEHMFGRKLRDLQGRHVLHSMLILRWQQHVGKSAVAVAVALGYAHLLVQRLACVSS